MPSSDSSNPMRDQVFSLPTLIREQIWTLEGRTRKIVTTPEMFAARDVVLTGSGDSYIGAMAAEAAFVELAGVRAHALSAMQASRYHARRFDWQYPSNPLVLAVSNSGEVARVVEAVQHYNDCGALTVAITGNPGSRLGQAASRVVEVTIPPFAPAPGVRSYYGSLLALYLLAIRMSEVRGQVTADEAMDLRRELETAADAVDAVIAQMDQPLQRLAQEWASLPAVELLGSGPDRATAAYGAAKLLEAVGVHAAHQDVEEWVHQEYFVADAARTGTILICPVDSPAFSRAVEVEGYLRTLQRPYLVLSGEPAAAGFRQVLAHTQTIRPVFAPLLYSAPLALFAAHLSAEVGAAYGRGASGPWADCHDGATTRGSLIL